MVQAFDMAFDLADVKSNEKDLISRDEEIQVSTLLEGRQRLISNPR